MDAESQLLADKDAEIARLKGDLVEADSETAHFRKKYQQLKKLNEMTDEQVVMDLKAEIERLKLVLADYEDADKFKNARLKEYYSLITELANALAGMKPISSSSPIISEMEKEKLIQRAREATK